MPGNAGVGITPVAWVSFDVFRALRAGRSVIGTSLTMHNAFVDDVALFDEAQLNQARADALKEAATMCEENHGTASLTASRLRGMAARIEGESK